MKNRVALLIRLLEEEHGITVPPCIARSHLVTHIEMFGSLFGIARQAAAGRITDYVLEDMANLIATDLTEQPR